MCTCFSCTRWIICGSKRCAEKRCTPYWTAGTCISIPDNTLEVILTLEKGDQPEDLENIHVVLQDKGENFQYNTGGNGGGWSKFEFNEFAPGIIPLPASFPHLPFDTDTVVRPIHLGELANRKGAQLIIGTRSNSHSGFKNGQVKKVHEIR